jgi:anaerobic carbon-monoxide dehydrogenase iron sulfur subunit
MSKLIKVVRRDQCIGCLQCMLACARQWEKLISVEKAALSVDMYPGAEGSFSIRLCYGCLEPDCAEACPVQALLPRTGGGVTLNPSLCIHCGKCVSACVPTALMWDQEKKQPIPCKHCGVCAFYCPNQVLELQEQDHD